MVGNYPKYRKPTRLERAVPEAFGWWIEDAQADEEARRKHTGGDDIESFAGFGAHTAEMQAEAWGQWLDFVDYVLHEHEPGRRLTREVNEAEDE